MTAAHSGVGALVPVGDRGDDRRAPESADRSERSSIASQVAAGLVDALAIGLVDHEDIADLHFSRLLSPVLSSPIPGDEDDDRNVSRLYDLNLVLTDADRLDDHFFETGRIQYRYGIVRSRSCKAAKVADRVAIERINTPGSVAWSCMRTRSPRMAPPVKGDGGIDRPGRRPRCSWARR